MRTAIASLILAAGLAGSASGQTPAPATAPAPAPTAQPMPSAPAAATPAPDATAPAPAPAAEAAPVPTLPTTGDAAEVLAALDAVCVPAVRGRRWTTWPRRRASR